MQFQVTEHAYNTLRAYLDRLSAHFGSTPDGVEIMRDIESRIAEKFIDAKHRLVTDRDVHAVIAEIGEASAFSDDEGTGTPPDPASARASEQTTKKRLYRDMDNAYIGGVSSGIATYFNIDPIWIRGAFILSIFTGGAGIVVYLILWLLIPEAKSASQKLEMNGRPVNLDTIAGVVKDRFEEAQKSGVLTRGAHAIDSIVRRLFRFIGIVVGALLTLDAFIAIIGATVIAGIVLMNWNAPWNDIPFKAAVSPTILWSAVIAAYTALVIPLVFIFTLGVRWMLKRNLLTTTVGFGLVGIWALALVSGGVLATKIGGDYYAYTTTSPEYARTQETRTVAEFKTISVERVHVNVVQGPDYSVTVDGRKMDMDNVLIESTDGQLTITSAPRDTAPCFFCHTRSPSVTITTPSLELLQVRSASASVELQVDTIVVDVRSGSISGTMKASDATFSLQSSHLGLDLMSASTSIFVQSGHVRIEGVGEQLSVTSRSSSVDADSFRTSGARVDSTSSFVEVHSSAPIDVISSRSSTIQNAGTNAGVSETETVEN